MTLAAALLFLVTSSADSGAGSLREAIAWANTTCNGEETQCEIRFAAPIALETPLPAITACGKLSIGASETLTQPPPMVELDGARLTAGNGFTVSAGCAALIDIRRVDIHGFPDAAIAVLPSASPFQRIGVVSSVLRQNGAASSPAPTR